MIGAYNMYIDLDKPPFVQYLSRKNCVCIADYSWGS